MAATAAEESARLLAEVVAVPVLVVGADDSAVSVAGATEPCCTDTIFDFMEAGIRRDNLASVWVNAARKARGNADKQ